MLKNMGDQKKPSPGFSILVLLRSGSLRNELVVNQVIHSWSISNGQSNFREIIFLTRDAEESSNLDIALQTNTVSAIHFRNEFDSPSSAFNKLAEKASFSHLIFIDSESFIDQEALNVIVSSNLAVASTQLILAVSDSQNNYKDLLSQPQLLHAYLLGNYSVPLSRLAIDCDYFKTSGGFCETPAGLEPFEIPSLVRLTKKASVSAISFRTAKGEASETFRTVFNQKQLRIEIANSALSGRCSETSQVQQQISVSADVTKLAIFVDFRDHHHSQLCFYNLLTIQAGFIQFEIFDFENWNDYEVLNFDAAIISRGRSNAALEVAKTLKKFAIPFAFMLDDNWFSVAKDYPEEYGELFGDNSLTLRTVKNIVSLADTGLVYNDVLASTLGQHMQNVKVLRPNVTVSEVPHELSSKKIKSIAYLGSPRKSTEAYEALAEISKNPKYKVYVYGSVTSRVGEIIRNSNIELIDFTTYDKYRETVAALNLDLFIAPLDDNAFSASKCPNKYLEGASFGLAGVFQQVAPYTNYVKEGINGYFIKPDASAKDWSQKILDIMSDDRYLNVARNAERDVATNFSSESVAQDFCDFIWQLSGRRA